MIDLHADVQADMAQEKKDTARLLPYYKRQGYKVTVLDTPETAWLNKQGADLIVEHKRADICDFVDVKFREGGYFYRKDLFIEIWSSYVYGTPGWFYHDLRDIVTYVWKDIPKDFDKPTPVWAIMNLDIVKMKEMFPSLAKGPVNPSKLKCFVDLYNRRQAKRAVLGEIDKQLDIKFVRRGRKETIGLCIPVPEFKRLGLIQPTLSGREYDIYNSQTLKVNLK